MRDKLDPVTVGIEGDWGSGKSSILEIREPWKGEVGRRTCGGRLAAAGS
ncbi:MAG: P-loop NTPase fold protein [Solirubrobacteraceae bacterium]